MVGKVIMVLFYVVHGGMCVHGTLRIFLLHLKYLFSFFFKLYLSAKEIKML